MRNKIVTEPRAPFPYFGQKRNAAQTVWDALGNVEYYQEPFCGSLGILLARPEAHLRTNPLETVNDKDAMLVNVWRALRADSDAVAKWCDAPVMEVEYHARLAYLQGERTADFVAWMEGDPDHYDAKLAGYWIYAQSLSIGSLFDSHGPWRRVMEADGEWYLRNIGHAGQGVNRKLPHIGHAGQGVNRELPHIGHAGQGVNRELPHITGAGKGVNRELPHITGAGKGDLADRQPYNYFRALSRRLAKVRVLCGDWYRLVASPSCLFAGQNNVGIFLDPPYAGKGADIYDADASATNISAEVREWCAKNGGDRRIRIAICGYDTEHDALLAHGWRKVQGKAGGAGYTVAKDGNKRERIWLSPYCIENDKDLFSFSEGGAQ